jgi:hypothetical protein
VRRFWPVGEGAQADYERLRAAVLAGTPLVGTAAARFAHSGLVGLVLQPSSPPIYSGVLLGAVRPSWSPYGDPREEALAEGYLLLLGDGAPTSATSALAAAGRTPT